MSSPGWSEEDSARLVIRIYLRFVVVGILIWVVMLGLVWLIEPTSTWARISVGFVMGLGGGFVGSGLMNAGLRWWRLRMIRR